MSYQLYEKNQGLNYNYYDKVIKSYFDMSGGAFYIYPIIGTYDMNGVLHPLSERKISDPVLNENSKRKYSKSAFELMALIKMATPKYNFTFSGLSLLDTDQKDIWIHYNSMIDTIGRKLIPEDVLEIPWIRMSNLDETQFSNKFYKVITSERYDENGWTPDYKYHIWHLVIAPLPNSSQYKDLFNTDNDFYEDKDSPTGGGGINPEITQDEILDEIDTKIEDEAEGKDEDGDWVVGKGVNYRLHNEHHAYYDKATFDELWKHNVLTIAGIDGIPVELNCDDVPYGEEFPNNPVVNDYFLRIDYAVPRLYRRELIDDKYGYWLQIELDFRNKWFGTPEPLRRIVNNENNIVVDNKTVPMKQNLKDLVPARVQKEKGKPRPWNKALQQEIKTETGVEYPIIGIDYPNS